MSEAEATQTATWKKPADACECIKWMEENKLMRWAETLDGPPIPIIDPFRGRKRAPYAPMKFCPNCAEPLFTVDAAPEEARA